jgi:hypothetical protein
VIGAVAVVVAGGIGAFVGARVLAHDPPPPPPAAPVATAAPPDDNGIVGLVSTPPGAQAFVDGKLVGITPMEALKLTPGRHHVVMRALGTMPAVRDYEVHPGGNHFEVDLPAARDVRVSQLTSTPSFDKPTFDKIAAVVNTPAARGLLTGCWELWSAASGKDELEIDFSYTGTVVTGDDGNEYPSIKLDWHDGSASGVDLVLRNCARTALDGGLKNLGVYKSAEVSMKLAPP